MRTVSATHPGAAPAPRPMRAGGRGLGFGLWWVAAIGACHRLGASPGADRGADASPGAGGDGDLPTVLETPAIELPGGGTTREPCVATTLQATAILRSNCAACHGGGSPGARQGQPPFDCVLDFDKLQTMVSASVPDPRDPAQGMRFVIPGDADGSRLYVRIADGEMPPILPLGLPPIPRPSVSDLSVLRTWITSCLGAPPAGSDARPATGTASDSGAPSAGVDASTTSSSTVGAPTAGGADAATTAPTAGGADAATTAPTVGGADAATTGAPTAPPPDAGGGDAGDGTPGCGAEGTPCCGQGVRQRTCKAGLSCEYAARTGFRCTP